MSIIGYPCDILVRVDEGIYVGLGDVDGRPSII
jgi:hypothetical protein